MDMSIAEISVAVVDRLAPFLPFLIEAGKTSVKKLSEVMAEKGGETAWNKAQALWRKVKTRFGGDSEVQSAATVVAAKPEDGSRQTMLAEILNRRLQEDPVLAKELLDVLGGKTVVQQVLADRSSWVENITQKAMGTGEQTVHASDDSVITGVKQISD
mgnify:CR=1 FL=1